MSSTADLYLIVEYDRKNDTAEPTYTRVDEGGLFHLLEGELGKEKSDRRLLAIYKLDNCILDIS